MELEPSSSNRENEGTRNMEVSIGYLKRSRSRSAKKRELECQVALLHTQGSTENLSKKHGSKGSGSRWKFH